MSDAADQSVELPDGRRLSFADLGPLSTPVVVYMHGNPGSRLDCADKPYNGALRTTGVRLVAADAPGAGRSDPLPAFRYEQIAADVASLLDHLGVRRCAVLGYSRGGLHALACGALLPERITAVGVLSGVGPPDMPELRRSLRPAPRLVSEVSLHAPALARLVARRSRRRADRSLDAMKRDWMRLLRSAPDRRVLDTHGEIWRRTFLEFTRQDPGLTVEEDRRWLNEPLGFQPEDITARVRIWHGDQDQLVPISHGRHLAERLPAARFSVLDHHGHLHTPEVVTRAVGELLEAEPRPEPRLPRP